jgi:hypothetical protein
MSKFNRYIRTTKFKARRDNRKDSFGDQFPKAITVPERIAPISDAEGIRRAYADGDTHVHGKTLYVAGSHTLRDWFDDVTKIPAWGDLRESARYKAADAALKANPQIKNVVGHSLGGSVALELQKEYGGQNLRSRTYGAPVWDPVGMDQLPRVSDGRVTAPKIERYRNRGDPFSYFDGSATNSIKWNPFDNLSMTHTYENIGSGKSIEDDWGQFLF